MWGTLQQRLAPHTLSASTPVTMADIEVQNRSNFILRSLRCGVNPNGPVDPERGAPVDYALSITDLVSARHLIAFGGLVGGDNARETFTIALKIGEVELHTFKQLVNRIPVETLDIAGDTMLHSVVRTCGGRAQLLRHLIKCGCSASQLNAHGKTVRQVAADAGHAKSISIVCRSHARRLGVSNGTVPVPRTLLGTILSKCTQYSKRKVSSNGNTIIDDVMENTKGTIAECMSNDSPQPAATPSPSHGGVLFIIGRSPHFQYVRCPRRYIMLQCRTQCLPTPLRK